MQLGDDGYDTGWSSGARVNEQSNREGTVTLPLPYKLVLLVLVFLSVFAFRCCE